LKSLKKIHENFKAEIHLLSLLPLLPRCHLASNWAQCSTDMFSVVFVLHTEYYALLSTVMGTSWKKVVN